VALALVCVCTGLCLLGIFTSWQTQRDSRHAWTTPLPGPGVAGWSLVAAAMVFIMAGVVLLARSVFSR
jgi:hypothetical protein